MLTKRVNSKTFTRVVKRTVAVKWTGRLPGKETCSRSSVTQKKVPEVWRGVVFLQGRLTTPVHSPSFHTGEKNEDPFLT